MPVPSFFAPIRPEIVLLSYPGLTWLTLELS